jgi:lysophospholipase L1-like esterase
MELNQHISRLSIPASVELLWGNAIRGDAPTSAVIDYSAGKKIMWLVIMLINSSAVSSDTQISGGLYARSGGMLVFKDGTNEASVAVGPWIAGDRLAIELITYRDGAMRLRKVGESTIYSAIPDGNDITTSKWTTIGAGTARESASRLRMAAVSNSRLTSAVSAYVDLVSGQTFRLSARIRNLSTGNNRMVFGITASTAPYEEVQIGPYTKTDGLIVAELTATRTCKVFVYFGNASSASGTCDIYDITGRVKSDNSNALVSFGDSQCQMAVEPGPFNDHLGSYTAQYAALLNIPYRNRGVSGETLTQINARLATQLGSPGTVFLQGGINDLFQASTDPTAAMQTTMTAMIAAAATANAKPVCFEIPKAYELGAKDAWRVSYNTWLHTYCNSRGVRVVPLSTLLCDSNGNQIPAYYTGGDFTHFNRLGHKVVSDWLSSNIDYVGDYIADTDTSQFAMSAPQLTITSSIAVVSRIIVDRDVVSGQSDALVDGL